MEYNRCGVPLGDLSLGEALLDVEQDLEDVEEDLAKVVGRAGISVRVLAIRDKLKELREYRIDD